MAGRKLQQNDELTGMFLMQGWLQATSGATPRFEWRSCKACNGLGAWENIRLDRTADAIQKVLYLARLLPDRIECARLLGWGRRPELGTSAKPVASRTSCCHREGEKEPKPGMDAKTRRKRRGGVHVEISGWRVVGYNYVRSGPAGSRRRLVLPGQVLFSRGRCGGAEGVGTTAGCVTCRQA